jgi:hypothetical protein
LPEPPTTEKPPLSTTQLAELNTALREAKMRLSRRDLPGASREIGRAEAIVDSSADGPHARRTERMRLLYEYVGEFWGAVDDGLADLAGQDLQVGNDVIHIQEVTRDHIRYRRSGQNLQMSRRDMPAGFARLIAERWLDNTPNSKIFVGAFMAVEPGYGLDHAREQWSAALARGAPVAELMPILDEL